MEEKKFQNCQIFEKLEQWEIVLLLSKYERLKMSEWKDMAQKTLNMTAQNMN